MRDGGRGWGGQAIQCIEVRWPWLGVIGIASVPPCKMEPIFPPLEELGGVRDSCLKDSAY